MHRFACRTSKRNKIGPFLAHFVPKLDKLCETCYLNYNYNVTFRQFREIVAPVSCTRPGVSGKKNPRPKSVQEAVPIAMDFVQPPPKHRLRRIMRCLRGCQDALLRRRRTGWLLAESAVLLVWSLNGCGTRPRLNHAAPASPHPRGFVLTGVPRREIQTRGVAGNRPGRPPGCEGTTGKKTPRRRAARCSHTCSAGCRIRLCSLV